MEEHLTSHHGIALQTKTLTFQNFYDFLKWKEEEEVQTKSWYVQRCAPKQHNDKEHWYYYCNRAGKYESRGKGGRSLKSQGSSKVISHCSAHIHASVDMATNMVTVRYNSTHYNHNTQLGHLRITSTTRKMIATKLQQGVTIQRILDDIRDHDEGTLITREHLINRKDVTNICNQYNIGIQKHPNDLLSVSSWVEEMETLEYNPVLLFKQQGDQPSEYCKNLEAHDFLLVIQTEFQRDMLTSHGSSGVCMDAKYKINDYDFNLITLMVLDDYQEGIPVAWALCTREDKSVLVHILTVLKDICRPLKPSWFMSDMAPQYFNAWEEVFGHNQTKHLWCALHVDRAWKEGIRRHVPTSAQQKEIYHQVRVLQMEISIPNFGKLLAQFLTLSQSVAPSFAAYFNSMYCTHVEQWAMCYRLGSPMNTNMYSEAFHHVLKIVYLEHKNRRVDYLLHVYVLLKIARDKAFDQLQKVEKGKNTHRICDINKRHKKALTFVSLALVEGTGENRYKVSSLSRPGVSYFIEKVEDCCACKLKCRFCSVCPHMYTCTCLDACTNTTVCKHMHLIQMQKPTSPPIETGKTDDHVAYYSRVTGTSTVEPLNKGHFGSRGFVLFSEVVLWWEVRANRSFIDLIYLDNMF